MIYVNILKKINLVIFLILAFFMMFTTVHASDEPALIAMLSEQQVSQGSQFKITAKVQNGPNKIFSTYISIPDLNAISYTQVVNTPNLYLGDIDVNAMQSIYITFNVDAGAPSNQPLISKITNSQNIELKLIYQNDPNNKTQSTQSFILGLPTTVNNGPAINRIVLPSIYTKAGNTSTNFKLLNNSNVSIFNEFKLDDTDKNSIVWKVPIDFTSQNLINALPQINKYVDISSYGKIKVDSAGLADLNKPATLLFRHLQFNSTPNIFKDGNLIDLNSKTINNFKYDVTARTVSVDVLGFSEYELGPVIKLISFVQTENLNTLQGNVNDPGANFKYSLDGGKTFIPIIDVDLDLGNFRINLPSKFDKALFTITATSSSGMSDTKSFDQIVAVTIPTIVPTVIPTQVSDSKNPFNILLLYSIIGAVIALLIFLIIIFFIIQNYKKNKSLERINNLNPKSDIDITKVKILSDNNQNNEYTSPRSISSEHLASPDSWDRPKDKS